MNHDASSRWRRSSGRAVAVVAAALACSLVPRAGGAADCNRNGRNDLSEIQAGEAPDCNGNLVPDECDVIRLSGYNLDRLPLPPGLVARADLDRDGTEDVVAVERYAQSWCRVLRGLGSGGFAEVSEFRVGPQGSGPTLLGDWDGDAAVDLCVCTSSELFLAFNGGRGSFSSNATLDLGSDILDIATADIDGDGDLDLAVAPRFEPWLEVLRNDGTGAFSSPQRYLLETSPTSVALADADGDLDADLVACNLRDRLLVLENPGDGAFAAGIDVPAGRDPIDLVVTDLDGTGATDFVLACRNGVSIVRRSLDGSFADPELLPEDSSVIRVLARDLDGDGDLDLISATEDAFDRSYVTVRRNAGAARLIPERYALAVETLHAQDVDRDGDLDLIAVSGSECSVVRNDGQGRFAAPIWIQAGNQPRAVTAADVDLDGDSDIVVGYSDGSLKLLLNDGEAMFDERLVTSTYPYEPTSVTTARLDPDDWPDAVLALRSSGTWVLPGTGDGGFDVDRKVILPGCAKPFVADLDGDGLDDVVAQCGAPAVYMNRAGQLVETFRKAALVYGVAPPADIDGDGDLDVPIIDAAVTVLRNDGGGAFAETEPILAGFDVERLACGDLDEDGRVDLVFTQRGYERAPVRTAIGIGGGAFAPPVELTSLSTARSVAVQDLDADGHLDVLVATGSTAEALWIFRGGGDGTFVLDQEIDVDMGADTFLAADFDRDGALDVLIADRNGVMILFRKEEAGPWAADANHDGVPDDCARRPFHRADSNGDGALDIGDPVSTFRSLFLGDALPACTDAADSNDDGRLDISDGMFSLRYLFLDGPPPPAPGPPPGPCGEDPEGGTGSLGCEAYGPC